MFEPYKDHATNVIYNLLFCDDLELYSSEFRGEPTGPWKELFSPTPDESSLAAIAANEQIESRIRLLAFNALRTHSKAAFQKQILGTVVEVGLPSGLETIAAYKDGRARYINYSGKLIIWEAPDSTMNDRIQRLLTASQNIVNKIGPWDKQRLAPPSEGFSRMTFLVTDGLYFGQGPSDVLENDAMGRPVITEATALIVDLINQVEAAQK
jgi:hypothetical protein